MPLGQICTGSKMKNKECIGCTIFDLCYIKRNKKNKVCPCQNCLIKITCTKECEKYEKFRRRFCK